MPSITMLEPAKLLESILTVCPIIIKLINLKDQKIREKRKNGVNIS